MTPCVVRGTVLSTADPTGLGRVKIQVPQATGRSGVWAAPATYGGAVAPAAGASVWVLFESGDPGLPVYIPTQAWGPWVGLPTGWVVSPWVAHSGVYRVGPAGQVQFQGDLATPNAVSSTTINNGSAVLALPASLSTPMPSSIPIGLLVGGVSGTTAAVLRVNGPGAVLYGGPWTYTGTTFLSLAALAYYTDF